MEKIKKYIKKENFIRKNLNAYKELKKGNSRKKIMKKYERWKELKKENNQRKYQIKTKL